MSVIFSEKELEKRKALIKVTYKLIAEHGFTNITLQDVADRADVSKGIILYYFENKEALFEAVLEWLVKRIELHIRAEVSRAEDPISKIKAFNDATFLGIKENREFYLVYLDFLAQSSHTERLRNVNLAFYNQCSQVQSQILRDGIEKGIFREVNTSEYCIISRALIDGLCIRWLFDTPERFTFYKQTALNITLDYLKK
ncbi:MAG TPA: TetR/AcrR family transcriptional regulator [bacterium]|nr:TetR/AcrR family transcriptional regulator [bacterium]